jgi:hypothetical protein
MRPIWRSAWRALGPALRQSASALLALLILFEEWGWEPLQRALARLGRLPLLRQIEAGVSRLPPRAALVAFLLPALLLLPVKLGALWLIGQHQVLLGLLLILLAKLLGTAVVARLFTLTRPALLRLPWFAALYQRWVVWKAALLAWVRAGRIWRLARAAKRRLRQRWARWRGRG